MTVTYRFFENGDYYSQENFADFIRTLLTDGYVPGTGSELAVSPSSPAGMSVNVGTGMAYVHGYIVEVEDSAVNLAIDVADATNPRIDRIVARMSATNNRNVTFAVLKGTPAATPAVPALTQNEGTWEIALAQVAVAAGTLAIVAANITDERVQCFNSGVGYPKATGNSFGIVKVGMGIRVSNGVITVPYSSYPLIAHIYGTDQNLGSFILGNTYNGTQGQLPQGIIFDEASQTGTRSLTLSITTESGETSATSTDGWSWSCTLSLKNVITGETRNVKTWSGTKSLPVSQYETLTHTVEVKWFEVAVASVSSWGALYGGYTRLSSTNFASVVNAYLGGIPPE